MRTVFGGFPGKKFEAFGQNFAQPLRLNLHLMRRNDGFINLGDNRGISNLLAQRTIAAFKETAAPRDGFDDAATLQFGVSLGHRISVHAQFFREWSNGRKGVAGPQGAGSGGVTDLVNQLQVNRLARFIVDAEDHI